MREREELLPSSRGRRTGEVRQGSAGHNRDTRFRPSLIHLDLIGVPYRIRTGVAAVRGGYLDLLRTAANSCERRLLNTLTEKCPALFTRIPLCILPKSYRQIMALKAIDGTNGQGYEPGNPNGPASPIDSGRALLALNRSRRPSRLLPRPTRRFLGGSPLSGRPLSQNGTRYSG